MSKRTALWLGIAVIASLTLVLRGLDAVEAPTHDDSSGAAFGEYSASEARRAEKQGKSGMPTAYLPTIPLKAQLSGLVQGAETGDAYSACILASATELCRRETDSPAAYDYPDAYLTRMSEEQAESFAIAVSNYEHEVSRICAGIEPIDARNRARWLLKAAIAGHTGSISKLLSWGEFSVDVAASPDKTVAVAFRGHAERMLNRAAEAGEIRAIERISIAYSMGEITNSLGSVSIKADDLKALAASQALALIRDESKKRKIPFDDFDDRELRAGIRSAVARMRREELARFSGFVSLYYDAYWKKYDRAQDEIGLISELPEQSCEALRRPAAAVADAASSARGAALRIGADDIGG